MNPSPVAIWLDTAFASFDERILGVVHQIQQSGADALLGPLSRLFALIGRGGIALILMGLLLFVLPRTRRLGAGLLLALALGALCTNLLIKPLVARERPYADEARLIRQWWLEAGAVVERDYSFPSGHTTAMTAAMGALFLLGDKRKRWLWLLFALFMPFSRLYLVVHYPTDVLAGFLTGAAAAILAAFIVRRFTRRESTGAG